MKDNIYIGEDAKKGIATGIMKCAKIVGGTMGTSGANAFLQCVEYPGHYTTNDGATILEALNFADPLEEMGRRILLEAVRRANKQSGDGSSTTTVLCASIILHGLESVKNHAPMEIKSSLEELIPTIHQKLNDSKKEVTVDNVGQVATISSESKEIGDMIQKIYQEIGKDGIIHWDISKTFDDYYTVGKGISIDGAGFVSAYMADLDEKTGTLKNQAKWKNPKILITKQKITSAKDFETLFSSLFAKDIKEIVVFCDEYEANVVQDLILTRAQRGFKTLLVKMPTIWKDFWYEDLSKATGATVIDIATGVNFANMNETHLGTVGEIIVTKDTVFLDGIADVSSHLEDLRNDGSNDSLLRVSRLNTATARYFVGAESDSALAYKRLKVEDAINAAYQALQNGVVAGGGVSLMNVARSLGDTTIGEQILAKALKAPFEQILRNASVKEDTINQIQISSENVGYDTKSRTCVDMIEQGIVDPTNIAINATRNAISVAASVLTCESIVLLNQ